MELTPSEIVLLQGQHFADKKKPIGAIVIMLLLLVPSIFMIISGGRETAKAWSSRSWPRAQGVILSAQAEPGSRGTVRADIVYAYQVDGVSYQAERVFFGDGAFSSDFEGVQEKFTLYPPEKEVQVAYDPKHPDIAVLEPGIRLLTVIMPLIGLMLLLAAYVLFVNYLSHLFKNK